MKKTVWQNKKHVIEIPANSIAVVRVSDDVHKPYDWGIDTLIIKEGIVVDQYTLTNGIYRIDNMTGWLVTDIMMWLIEKDDVPYPCKYREIVILTKQ